LDEVKREELELLETQSAPLRNYLMKHILPTVNRALIECLKVRPDDAVDYLVSESVLVAARLQCVIILSQK